MSFWSGVGIFLTGTIVGSCCTVCSIGAATEQAAEHGKVDLHDDRCPQGGVWSPDEHRCQALGSGEPSPRPVPSFHPRGATTAQRQGTLL